MYSAVDRLGRFAGALILGVSSVARTLGRDSLSAEACLDLRGSIGVLSSSSSQALNAGVSRSLETPSLEKLAMIKLSVKKHALQTAVYLQSDDGRDKDSATAAKLRTGRAAKDAVAANALTPLNVVNRAVLIRSEGWPIEGDKEFHKSFLSRVSFGSGFPGARI